MNRLRHGNNIFRFSFVGYADTTIEHKATALAHHFNQIFAIGINIISGTCIEQRRRHVAIQANHVAEHILGQFHIGFFEHVHGLAGRDIADEFKPRSTVTFPQYKREQIPARAALGRRLFPHSNGLA